MANNANYVEIMNRFGESILSTTKQIAEINVKAGEKLLEQQAELANQLVSATTRGIDLAAKTKSYQELLAGQAQIAQEYGQQVLAGYRRAADVLNEAGKAVAATVDQASRVAREDLAKSA